MKDDESLPEDLRGLFASERRAPGAPSVARDRVAARLAASLAAMPAPSASRPGGSRASAPSWRGAHFAAIVTAFAAGAAVGALATGHREAGRGRVESAPGTVVSATEARPAPPATPEPSAALSASAAPSPASPPAGSSSGTRGPEPRASTLALEQSILDTARVGLGREDGQAALDATDAHAKRFPRGQLREEREAIAIQALLLLHRTDEARDRAARFAKAYPTSALLPAVRDALGGPP